MGNAKAMEIKIMKDNTFFWLQQWYYKNCNGDWEHERNIEISTIDNPGWSISLNLEDTNLKNKKFKKIKFDRNDKDWLFCEVKNHKFEGRCGPLNLLETLEIFRNWAESDSIDNNPKNY